MLGGKIDGKGVAAVVVKENQNSCLTYGPRTITSTVSRFTAPLAEFVEVKGCLNALIWAKEHNWKEILIFSDCLNLIQALKHPDQAHRWILPIITDIIYYASNFFSFCSIRKICRTGVYNANNLAVCILSNY